MNRGARVLLIPETKNGNARRSAALQSGAGGSRWTTSPNRWPGVGGASGLDYTGTFGLVCKAAGIKDLTFHDLRHEAASRLGERGFSAMEVAALTGHKTMQMVKRYTHPRAEDFVERLG